MSLVNWMDKCPLWLKIVFALPCLDIVWAIYRIVKGLAKGHVATLLGGILWLLLGWAIMWIVDIICIIVTKEVKVLAA